MTTDDADRFARCMARLVAAFNQPMSDDRAVVYLEALRDLPIGAIERATARAIADCTFFPKVAELRHFACEPRRDRVPVARRLAFKPAAPIPGAARALLERVLGGTPFGNRVLAHETKLADYDQEAARKHELRTQAEMLRKKA